MHVLPHASPGASPTTPESSAVPAVAAGQVIQQDDALPSKGASLPAATTTAALIPAVIVLDTQVMDPEPCLSSPRDLVTAVVALAHVAETQLASETQAVDDWEGLLHAMPDPHQPLDADLSESQGQPVDRPSHPSSLPMHKLQAAMHTPPPVLELNLVLTEDQGLHAADHCSVESAAQRPPSVLCRVAPAAPAQQSSDNCKVPAVHVGVATHAVSSQPSLQAARPAAAQPQATPGSPAPATWGPPSLPASALPQATDGQAAHNHGLRAEAAPRASCPGTDIGVASTQLTDYGDCSIFPSLDGSQVLPPSCTN